METKENMSLVIHAPDGYLFRKCASCANPYLADGSSENCIFCDLKKYDSTEAILSEDAKDG